MKISSTWKIFEVDTIGQAQMKEKKNKEYLKSTTSRNEALQQKSHQRNKRPGSLPCKVLRTILKMDKTGTQTNRPNDKEIKD